MGEIDKFGKLVNLNRRKLTKARSNLGSGRSKVKPYNCEFYYKVKKSKVNFYILIKIKY